MAYMYKQTEPYLYTVGFIDGDNVFCPESDHGSAEEAAARVRFLNGGSIRDHQVPRDHALRAGMMWCEDNTTPPRGRVIIHADDQYIHVVMYEVHSSVIIAGLFVRTVGVDTLPGFTQWCDRDTAAAVQTFLIDQDLWEPPQWADWYSRERFGPIFRQRRYSAR